MRYAHRSMAIVGFSRIIAESEDAQERQTYYEIVESNNERLLTLINEILDLSKIESGIVEFTTTQVKTESLVRGNIRRTPIQVSTKRKTDIRPLGRRTNHRHGQEPRISGHFKPNRECLQIHRRRKRKLWLQEIGRVDLLSCVGHRHRYRSRQGRQGVRAVYQRKYLCTRHRTGAIDL